MIFQQTQGAVISGGQQTVVAGPVVTGTVPMGQQFTGVQYQTTQYQQGWVLRYCLKHIELCHIFCPNKLAVTFIDVFEDFAKNLQKNIF